MMSISAIASSKGYYQSGGEVNYYLEGEMQSYFTGEGSRILGVHGEKISLEEQNALMNGILMTGETVQRFSPTKHRSGFDLTFSAPKSISVLSLITGNKDLLIAHNKAVNTALNEIEQFASVKNRVDKTYKITPTKNLVIGCHTHDTSRELDPQLHTHALVFNVTQNANGEWQALSSDKINKQGFIENVYANVKTFGNIYRQTLRNEVESLGYETVDVGKGGLWELKDVPTDEFSTRRKQILNSVGEDATAKEKEQATLKTRKLKTDVDRAELLIEWQDRLKQTGFNEYEYYLTVLNNKKQLDDKQQVNPINDKLDFNSKKAVNKAILTLTNNSSQISYNDLLNTALSYSMMVKGVVESIKQNIDYAITQDSLVPIDKEKSNFVSKLHIEREKSLSVQAKSLSNKGVQLDNKFYNEDKGVMALFNENKQVAIINGKSDTNTLIERIEKIDNATRLVDKKIILAVDSKKMKDSFIKNGLNNTLTLSELEKTTLNEKDIVILPFGEKLSQLQTIELMKQSNIYNNQLVFFNNEAQIGLGNPLSVLSKNGITNYNFTENITKNININVTSISDKKLRNDLLVSSYVDHNRLYGNAVIIGNTQDERNALNENIRNELKLRGQLGVAENNIKILKPIYLNAKNKENIQNYKKGMILEQWDNEKKEFKQFSISSIDNDRRLIYSDKSKSPIKLNDIANYSLYEKKSLSISENDQIKTLGSMLKGKLKANTPLKIDSIDTDKHIFMVSDKDGKQYKLYLSDTHKLEHDYAQSVSSSINKNKTVFVSISNRNLNENIVNSLIKQGENIHVFTSVDEKVATKKLSTYSGVNIITDKVKGNEFNDLNMAISERKKQLLTPNQKAIYTGIEIATGGEVAFPIIKAIDNAYRSNPNLNLTDLHSEFNSMVKSGEIIELDNNIAITKESYIQEKAIQTQIAKGINAVKPLINSDEFNKDNFNKLTLGQRSATEHILTSKDRFIGIQGFAGVGKTTQLKTVLSELNKHRPDLKVIGLAPTHRAVFELKNVGIESQTISSFLVENQKIINSGKKLDFTNTLFIIDEASMIGNKNTSALYEQLANGNGRGIYSGDVKQLLSIDSGASFSLQQKRTDLKFSIMKDIVRQDAALKPAVYSMINNDIKQSISVIKSLQHEVPRITNNQFEQLGNFVDTEKLSKSNYESLYDYIAQDYSSRTNQVRDETVIVTQLNEDRKFINSEIHEQLRKDNLIGQEEKTIQVLTPILLADKELKSINAYAANKNNILSFNKEYYLIEDVNTKSGDVIIKNLSNNETVHLEPSNLAKFADVGLYKPDTIDISVNDKIIMNRTNIDDGIVANSEWKVKQINDKDIHLINSQNRTKIIDLNSLSDQHFDLGYALTDYGVQGMSSKYVIAYLKSDKHLASARSFYVALSRAVHHASIVTDKAVDFVSNVKGIEDRLSAVELLENSSLLTKDIDALSYNNENKIKTSIDEFKDTPPIIIEQVEQVDELPKDDKQKEVQNTTNDLKEAQNAIKDGLNGSKNDNGKLDTIQETVDELKINFNSLEKTKDESIITNDITTKVDSLITELNKEIHQEKIQQELILNHSKEKDITL